MKCKKGISPLIATVLVIGFTIVLAALVMQWGTQLFQKTQEDTGKASDINLICSTKLINLDLVSAVKDAIVPTMITLTIDNKNDQEVVGLIVRAYDANNGVLGIEIVEDDPLTTTVDEAKIAAWEVKSFPLTFPVPVGGTAIDLATVKKLGVLLKIKATDGSINTCSSEKTIYVS